MSNSIYQIQQDLFDVFNEIESNEGVLTEELEQKLNITQDAFKDKIKSYANYIKHLESQIAEIKEEKQRLDNLKKSKEKTIERLKDVMISAINTFGDVNKSGNHFVDYDTGKVMIKPTESVQVNDENLSTITDGILRYFRRKSLYEQTITTDSIEDLVKDINLYIDDEANFTTDDLRSIDGNLQLQINIDTFLNNPECIQALEKLMSLRLSYDNPVKDITFDPTLLKAKLKETIKKEGTELSFANINVKDSLVIK